MNQIISALFFLALVSLYSLHPGFTYAQNIPPEAKPTQEQKSPRISLTPAEQAWLEKSHTVRVRVGDYPPNYFIKDGKPLGVAIDLLMEISIRSGVKFHFIIPSPSFEEDLEGLKHHTGPDLLPSLQASQEREKSILFTDAYLTNSRFIFTRIDAPFVSTIEDLSGKTVAVEQGFLVQKWLEEKYQDVNLLSVNSSIEALKAVSLGRAFAYIGPVRPTATMINKYGFNNLKATSPSSLPDAETSMAIRSDWPELMSILNKSLDSIPESEKTAIINKWSTVKFDHGIRRDDVVKWLLAVAGFGVAVVLLFFVWNRQLRRQIKNRTADLVESEHQFRATFEQAAVGIAHVGLDGNFLIINKKFCDIVGYSRDEMYALSFQDITHPDDLETDLENIQRLLDGKAATYSMEKRYFRKDGQIVWVNLTVSLIRKSDESPNWFVSVVEDISERKQAQEAHKISEQRFRAMMEQSPFSIVVNSPDGRIIQVNQAFMDLWGISVQALPEVLEAYNILEDEEARKRGVMPLIERAFRGEIVSLPEIEYDVTSTMREMGIEVDESGKRWVQVRFYPIKGDRGELLYVVAVEGDITERRKAENAFKQSEEKFRELVRQSPFSIQIVKPDGYIEEVNQAFMELWGITEKHLPEVLEKYNMLEDEEARKRGVLPLIKKAFNGEAVILPVIEYDGSSTMDALGVNTEANKVWIQVRLYPIKNDKGEVIRVVDIEEDITDRILAEKELQNSMSEIKRLKDLYEKESLYLREEISLEHNYKNIIGKSNAIQYTLFKVEQVAETDTGVIILGETGTGKELIARAIHHSSLRKDRPLVKINCATLPANLIESELFGHERGSFTGAHSRQTGRFEVADGSSIFLDEIGELPIELQAKLLRVIEDGEFERLGSTNTLKVDVRIIAATNRDLEQDVQEGRFRQDLWFRLNVYPITLPPLRERREDIPLLIEYYVDIFARKLGKKIVSVPSNVLKTLQGYEWPGNVRELANVLERAVISTTGSKLRLPEELKLDHRTSPDTFKSLHDMERDYIIKALDKTKWKVSGKNSAAELLGLQRSTLRAKMQKLDIHKP